MRLQARNRLGICAATGVALALMGASIAGASSVDDKRQEASRIAAQVDSQAGRVANLDLQFRQAQERLAQRQASVGQVQVRIAATLRRQQELRGQLAYAAVEAYVRGGSTWKLSKIANGGNDMVLRGFYLKVIGGNDRESIDNLTTNRQDLQSLQKLLGKAVDDARADADSINRDRAALDAAKAAQLSLLGQVRGELAGLVAAEQARRDAAARALLGAPRPSSGGGGGAPAARVGPSGGAPGGIWSCIRQLESGNNYGSPGGGAYQFTDATWQGLGGTGTASSAPPDVQDAMAVKLQQQRGWAPWTTAPACGRG